MFSPPRLAHRTPNHFVFSSRDHAHSRDNVISKHAHRADKISWSTGFWHWHLAAADCHRFHWTGLLPAQCHFWFKLSCARVRLDFWIRAGKKIPCISLAAQVLFYWNATHHSRDYVTFSRFRQFSRDLVVPRILALPSRCGRLSQVPGDWAVACSMPFLDQALFRTCAFGPLDSCGEKNDFPLLW